MEGLRSSGFAIIAGASIALVLISLILPDSTGMVRFFGPVLGAGLLGLGFSYRNRVSGSWAMVTGIIAFPVLAFAALYFGCSLSGRCV
ncbi:MAG: hypothetical protein AAFR88_02735 [Pseudomonadota bacterium]